LALGAACLAASLGAQGGRVSTRLDLLADAAPFWLLGGLVVAAYGLLLASPRLRLAVTGLGAASILASMALLLPELTRPIRPPVAGDPARQIKLIQFNAHEYNAARVEGAADWLARQDADFILMEDAGGPMRQALAKRGFRFTRGIADTGIFSRAPQAAAYVIPESTWPLLPSFARATYVSRVGPVSLVAVHLPHPTDRSQLPRALALAGVLDHYDRDRLIVAGDFNLAPWSFGLGKLDKRFGLERRDQALFSWPAYRLPLALVPIDHLYAGHAWRTVEVKRGPRLGSNHYPIVATLALDN
jgi:endonuclease/exonuclease/phosphatase (EEP) superfamily protein YafD